jgi:hypothetical protein
MKSFFTSIYLFLILSLLVACTTGEADIEPSVTPTAEPSTIVTPTQTPTPTSAQTSEPTNAPETDHPDIVIEPDDPVDFDVEELSDELAKALFVKAVREIIFLSVEEPSSVISRAIGADVKIPFAEKNIDGRDGPAYIETTGKYKELQDYYAKVFAGDALDWILSTKFADVDGILYCSQVGGATGWGIANVVVTNIGQNNDQCTYEAIFINYGGAITDTGDSYLFAYEGTIKSQFAIVKTENGYKISSIDYKGYLL